MARRSRPAAAPESETEVLPAVGPCVGGGVGRLRGPRPPLRRAACGLGRHRARIRAPDGLPDGGQHTVLGAHRRPSASTAGRLAGADFKGFAVRCDVPAGTHVRNVDIDDARPGNRRLVHRGRGRVPPTDFEMARGLPTTSRASLGPCSVRWCLSVASWRPSAMAAESSERECGGAAPRARCPAREASRFLRRLRSCTGPMTDLPPASPDTDRNRPSRQPARIRPDLESNRLATPMDAHIRSGHRPRRAAERTLAWLSHRATIIALGFVVSRFGLFVQLARSLQSQAAPPAGRQSISAVLGVRVRCSSVGGDRGGRDSAPSLRRHAAAGRWCSGLFPVRCALVLSLVVAGLGVALAGYLLLAGH